MNFLSNIAGKDPVINLLDQGLLDFLTACEKGGNLQGGEFTRNLTWEANPLNSRHVENAIEQFSALAPDKKSSILTYVQNQTTHFSNSLGWSGFNFRISDQRALEYWSKIAQKFSGIKTILLVMSTCAIGLAVAHTFRNDPRT